MLIIIKIAVSILVVLILSYIAERSGPRIAGFFSGFPTGTAITLFFIGFEQSAVRAGEVAIYNITGIISLQFFLLGFYLVRLKSRILSTILSTAAGFLFYSLTVIILNMISFNRAGAVLMSVIFCLGFVLLFRNIKTSVISARKPLTLIALIFRSIIASTIIISVILISKYTTPRLAGLFTAFPSTLFPLLLIIDLTYTREDANSIIKNVPSGLFSLIIFSFMVSFTFPLFGVVAGLLIAYAVSIIYSLIYLIIKREKCRIQR